MSIEYSYKGYGPLKNFRFRSVLLQKTPFYKICRILGWIPEIDTKEVMLLIGTDAPAAHIPLEVRSGDINLMQWNNVKDVQFADQFKKLQIIPKTR